MRKIFARYALSPIGWLSNVEIHIDSSGHIAALTPLSQEVPDCSALVLPGMSNLHSHAFQRAMAGLGETRGQADDDFWSWRHTMYRLANSVTPDQLKTIASHLYMEMIEAGYTEVAEFHYLHRLVPDEEVPGFAAAQALIVAAEVAGIRLTLVPVLYERSGFGAKGPLEEQARFALSPEEYLELLSALKPLQSSQMRLGIGFHSLRAVHETSIDLVLAGAAKLGLSGPIHIHIAEQQGEVDQCLEAHRQRPVEWLYNNVDVNERWCLVHATHLSDKEAELIARSGAVAGLCPTTEANLGDGTFDLTRFEALGGHYGVGSDSHITVDPFDELRWLEYSNRLQARKRLIAGRAGEQPCGRQLFQQALAGGRAVTCGTGGLEVGAPADLLLIQNENPLLAGRSADEMLNSLIFAGAKGLISEVLVGGISIAVKGEHPQKSALLPSYTETLRQLIDRHP
ncbi:MAG: formimidoylglutamate deiminase [Alphaproteobacteria bacterium]|nr:MAG: formimidoylglutamate deiminase [Alphaproteobacteria bacterium]